MFVCACAITTAGILLLFFVITHSMKKRVRETGILMSLGITGKEIKRQFLWEHLLIGIAAFLLASLVSFAITPIVGEQIYGAVHQLSLIHIWKYQNLLFILCYEDCRRMTVWKCTIWHMRAETEDITS